MFSIKIRVALLIITFLIISGVECKKLKHKKHLRRSNADYTYNLIVLKKNEQDASLGVAITIKQIMRGFGVTREPKIDEITFVPNIMKSLISVTLPGQYFTEDNISGQIINSMNSLRKDGETDTLVKNIYIIGHWSQMALANSKDIVTKAQALDIGLYVLSCICTDNFPKGDVVRFCREGVLSDGYDGTRQGLFEFNGNAGLRDLYKPEMLLEHYPKNIPAICFGSDSQKKECFETTVIKDFNDKPTNSYFHYMLSPGLFTKVDFKENPTKRRHT
jgi:hypothetical protein